METQKQDTVVGNELIADFFGARRPAGTSKVFKWVMFNDAWASEGLKFHKSWDWLMPVVEKIRNQFIATEYGTGVTVLEIEMWGNTSWRCFINYRTHYDGVNSKHRDFTTIGTDPLRCVWKSVTSFITWYNNQ